MNLITAALCEIEMVTKEAVNVTASIIKAEREVEMIVQEVQEEVKSAMISGRTRDQIIISRRIKLSFPVQHNINLCTTSKAWSESLRKIKDQLFCVPQAAEVN